MRRIYQVASLVVLAVSVYVIWEAKGLDYMSSLGPGPGFFPLWMGIVLAALSIGWLVQVSTTPQGPLETGFVPDRRAALRILSIVGALVVLSALLEIFGFQVTGFLFLLFLLFALGRQNPLLTVVLSLVGSFGTYYLFKVWLQVPLPTAGIDFLQNLGL